MTCKWCGRTGVVLFPGSGVCHRCAAQFDGVVIHGDRKRARVETMYTELGLEQGKVWKLVPKLEEQP